MRPGPRLLAAGARRLQVFAVEDTIAQVCWGALPRGTVTFSAGGVEVSVVSDGRPGAVDLEGLPAATNFELTMTIEGRRAAHVTTFRTLAPPPGRLLAKFATINDLHIGEQGFGLFLEMKEPEAAVKHPLRCLRAALAEAAKWGATSLLVKGDLTHGAHPKEWDVVAEELERGPLPVRAVIPGNHDVVRKGVPGGPFLAEHGIPFYEEPTTVDLPGITVVMLNTTAPGAERGIVDAERRARAVELLAGASGPAFVALHHYPQRFRLPTMWPPGIPSPSSTRLLDAIAEANPRTFVTSGHSHRHRGMSTARSSSPRSDPPRTTRGPGLATPCTKAESGRWCGVSPSRARSRGRNAPGALLPASGASGHRVCAATGPSPTYGPTELQLSQKARSFRR